MVDPQVLGKVAQAEGAVSEYKDLEQHQFYFQVTYFLIFAAITLVLLFVAIWIGLLVANQIVRPISYLIEASRQVGLGNLRVRIPERSRHSKRSSKEGEISALIHAFNIMASKLELQQSELKEASQQIENRQQFTESVLSNVSAGVIGLNEKTEINLSNKSASFLLGISLDQKLGHPILEVFPEISELLTIAIKENAPQIFESQVHFSREGHTLTFLVRIACERQKNEGNNGFVVTFEDL